MGSFQGLGLSWDKKTTFTSFFCEHIIFLHFTPTHKQLSHMKIFEKTLVLLMTLFGVYQATFAQNIITMEEDAGVYRIPCKINGLKLKFIFDTGASSVCISENVALMMLENDYLSKDDIVGVAKSQVADGRIVDNTKVILKKIEIGDKVITNVEAVVIHNQSAPLLFGQSAIQKLGKYSISGNKLVFGTSKSNGKNYMYLTEEEEEKLFEEAHNAYFDNAYNVAAEKYKVLFEHNKLSALGIKYYADCCYYSDQRDTALELYLDIEDDIIDNYPNEKIDLFYQIARSSNIAKDYDMSLGYFKKVLYYETPWSNLYVSAYSYMASVYYDKGDEFKAMNTIDNCIKEYLRFMDIKASDCWTKHYVDQTLAELYYRRYLCSRTEEFDKYQIISAAWGYDKAIEYCKKYNLTYQTKPYKYEY